MSEPLALYDPITVDILGQLPMLHMYTQITLIFPVESASLRPVIIKTLEDGLQSLTKSFPWLGGQVINEGSGPGNSGTFRIVPYTNQPSLSIKTSPHPSFAALQAANFPGSLLDENDLGLRSTMPRPADLGAPHPVFSLHANFVDGGLLLTFITSHNAMDMSGHASVMRLLAQACTGKPYTASQLTVGNTLSPPGLMPLHDAAWEPSPRDTEMVMFVPPPIPTSAPQWAYFTFSGAALSALKSRAMETVGAGWVSTDDALTALIWQSITRVRSQRLDAAVEVKLSRAVDVRRFLSIPETYPGMCVSMTTSVFTLCELVEAPLRVVAKVLRGGLEPEALAKSTCAVATVLDRTLDKGRFLLAGALELQKDVMVTSWAKEGCYEMDFGWGKAEAVRRPRFHAVEGLVMLMPKRGDGEVVVSVCMRDGEMELLRADEEWARYASYCG